MELNISFDKKLEATINSFQPLADWFERNQKTMAYYEFTHKGCLSSENSSINHDIMVLSRMANACFSCLESQLSISPEDKAKYAAFCIASIYDEEQETLSDTARTKYYLEVEEIQNEDNISKSKYL